MKKTFSLLISGVVQGVFFRAYLKEHADRLAIRGWVRNRKNGSVELLFGADTIESYNQFMLICQKGSPQSQVSCLELSVVDHVFNDDSFSVLETC